MKLFALLPPMGDASAYLVKPNRRERDNLWENIYIAMYGVNFAYFLLGSVLVHVHDQATWLVQF